jgi:hypothetical protein
LNIVTPAVNCWGEFHFVPYSRVTEVVVMVVGPTEFLLLDTGFEQRLHSGYKHTYKTVTVRGEGNGSHPKKDALV